MVATAVATARTGHTQNSLPSGTVPNAPIARCQDGLVDAAIAPRLRDLFSQLKVATPDEEQWTHASPERAIQIGLGPGSFYLDDAAHAELNSLVEKLAASALVHGGRHPTELENLITTSCRKALDEEIQALAPEFPLSQMAAVDRNILRIALYELRVSGDAPAAAIIDEAVELAKLFGSEASRKFVNGVLATAVGGRKDAAP